MSGKGDRFFFFTLGVCCVEVSRNEKNSLFFFFSLKKKKKKSKTGGSRTWAASSWSSPRAASTSSPRSGTEARRSRASSPGTSLVRFRRESWKKKKGDDNRGREKKKKKLNRKRENKNRDTKKTADRPRDPPAADSHATDRIVLLTGISGTPCNTPWGDYLLEVQLRNKADWARLHGEFVFEREFFIFF